MTGGRGRGGRRSRGRGGDRHGGHHDQREGSGARGRGRNLGGGRDRRSSGDASRTGFVAGAALADWEAPTPDRLQSNGRGGRTPEGVNAGSRQQTSSVQRGSRNNRGVSRPEQNPFAFVSFDYSRLDSQRRSVLQKNNNSPSAGKVAIASDSREIVVPAIEGRVEVYIDRKGSQEVLEALELETGHTGLGYVDQESAGCTNHTFVKESGNVVYSELNCVEDKNVAALEAMQVDTEEDDRLHLKTPNYLKSSVSTSKTKKNRRGESSVEKASKKGINGGYISIGGLKVFTEAGVTYSDESVDLDKESDVSLELNFTSGKKRWSKGGKKDKKQFLQRGEWLDDSFSESGESIIDSSDSDLDDDLVEDYIANLEGAGESVDASWLLKNKMKQVAVEDMGCHDDDDDDDDSSSTGASGSDDGSSDSGSASAERMWRLKWQRKGKELMDTDVHDDDDDDELDSGLDDISEEIVLGGSGGKRGRKTQTALLLGKLELEDSEEDSHDEEDFDQLIDVMEDEKFMPDYVNKTLGKSKQKKKKIKKSIDPVTWPIQVHQSKTKPKSIPGKHPTNLREGSTFSYKSTQRNVLDLKL